VVAVKVVKQIPKTQISRSIRKRKPD
jgi:hypothetical protein